MQEKIKNDVIAAMKAGEKERLETLKMLKSALQMATIEQKGDLSEEAAMKVLAKEQKKRLDAAKMYEDAGDSNRANAEKREAGIIAEYLPEQMSEEAVAKIVDDVVSGGADNMGAAMGQVMAKVGGQADGGMVSRLVKERLNQ